MTGFMSIVVSPPTDKKVAFFDRLVFSLDAHGVDHKHTPDSLMELSVGELYNLLGPKLKIIPVGVDEALYDRPQLNTRFNLSTNEQKKIGKEYLTSTLSRPQTCKKYNISVHTLRGIEVWYKANFMKEEQ